eukprot:jgi/Mesen1/4526/ME000230S03671
MRVLLTLQPGRLMASNPLPRKVRRKTVQETGRDSKPRREGSRKQTVSQVSSLPSLDLPPPACYLRKPRRPDTIS